MLALAVEKQGDNMVALCPRCYTMWNELHDGTINMKASKCKGVSIKQNPLKHTDSCDVHFGNTTIRGTNTNLRFGKTRMIRLSVDKSALTGRHTKGIVQPNGAVHPFIMM